jgi:TorA maturation chaperone TorD
MPTKDDIQVLLAGRAGAYRVFQGIFGNEPSSDSLQSYTSQTVQDILRLFIFGNNPGYENSLDAFSQVVKDALKDDQAIERIEVGFTRLFVGPGTVEANPWESIYATNEKVLFQAVTLEVRKAYVAQGFIPNSYPHVADDHIALELDFMALLGERIAQAITQDDSEQALAILDASKEFLHNHLLRFVTDFSDAIKQAKHNYFYKEAGALLNEFLKVDAGALEEIKSYLES